jgi:hypothetical protein
MSELSGRLESRTGQGLDEALLALFQWPAQRTRIGALDTAGLDFGRKVCATHGEDILALAEGCAQLLEKNPPLGARR